MKKIMEEILDMPYYKNYAATSGAVHNTAKHEDAVQAVLESHGLREYVLPTQDGKKKLLEGCLAGKRNDMPDNSFISQPCGTHNSPDFLVKKGGRFYPLECKSVKGASPMFNSALPKPNFCYVFTSEKYDETTLFLGQDIIRDEEREQFEQLIKRKRESTALFNSSLENSHGIQFYDRPMFTHKGANQDYFKNEKRKQFEQNVLEFKGIISG